MFEELDQNEHIEHEMFDRLDAVKSVKQIHQKLYFEIYKNTCYSAEKQLF